MTKQLITPKDGPPPVGPYSPGVIANGFLFVSGQIPLDPTSGELVTESFNAQTRQTLANLQSVLEAAGAAFNDVVKVTIFLSDMGNFAELNDIYAEFFSESKPARACVEASRLPKNVDIEIEAIAMIP